VSRKNVAPTPERSKGLSVWLRYGVGPRKAGGPSAREAQAERATATRARWNERDIGRSLYLTTRLACTPRRGRARADAMHSFRLAVAAAAFGLAACGNLQ